MESAFIAMYEAQPVMKKIYQAQRDGKLPRKQPLEQTIEQALLAEVISDTESKQLLKMNALRFSAISVDSFKAGDLESRALISADVG